MKNVFIFIILLCLPVIGWGQQDSTLCKLTGIVEELRSKDVVAEDYGAAVSKMYNIGKKVSLLDDIGSDKSAEYHGTDMNRFRLNSVVANVDELQSGVNLSKSNYFDSRRRGVYYSLIEKSVKAGAKADFTISEHKGHQEIVVIPYAVDPEADISVECGGRTVKNNVSNGRYVFNIEGVEANDIIHVIISNKSDSFQSFAIINYNQKK